MDDPVSDPGLRGQIAALVPDLRGFARFLVRDRAMADDLVQDVLVRALSALHQFEPGTNLKAWLFTILRNAFYEGARRRQREATALARQSARDEAAAPVQDARSELRDLQLLIWTLPPLLREALILVGAQEMTYEEAASICRVPVGTVKARVSRGRAALAAAIRRAEEGDVGGHEPSDT
ncbi:MAG TPA: sigma-70 family RNA polymerase sigma factor [Acetobacteraceae bacterium]|jgi:RNA polymerase sigma-70 factor (ECF subfamily)|nr:sigma-70 family RNA polymerase sigma factor [Acetobacteraceae bacterium]